MFIIGNIVVKGNAKISVPRMNVVSEMSEINNQYPTLLIGYYELKPKYTLDFLNRKLGDNLFWTFKRDEERTMYNRDLYDFVIHCEEQFMSGFEYYPIDPFKIKRKSVKKIIKHITTTPSIFHIDKDMLFIHTKGITFGFNLGIGKVIGIKKDKILTKLITKYKIPELPQEQIDSIYLSMGDIEFDSAQLPYLSEKIQE